MNDPFQILGISPSASEDEIKAAYRKLAKQYHPDLNPGSATAEAKMKQINEAYTLAMKMKKEGYTGSASSYGQSGPYGTGSNPYGSNPYGGSSYGSNGYGPGNPYTRQQQGQQWDPFGFGGFGGFGGYQRQQAQHTSSRTAYDNPELQAASDYIQTGRYQEALHLLNRVPGHDAAWHGLFARANLGLGNRVAALNSARAAVQLEPDNPEYQQLLEQLEYGAQGYQRTGGAWDFKSLLCANPCLTCCLANTLCNCLGNFCVCRC